MMRWLLASLLLLAPPVWAGIDFDGTDDAVDCGSASDVDNLTALTFAAWVYPDSLAGDEFAVIAKGRGNDANVKMLAVGDWFGNSDVLVVFLHAATTNAFARSANGTMTTGSWQHIAATWAGSGNAPKLYKNGAEVSYAEQNANVGTVGNDSARNLVLGARDNVAPTYNIFFNGLIDEACVYNDDLTDAQVAQIAVARTRRICQQVASSALVRYFTIDEGQDGTSADGDTVFNQVTMTNNCTGDDGGGNANLTWTGGQVSSYP